MTGLLYLIPIALFLGIVGLLAFLWALRSGQFEDLDGAAHRVLFDDDTAASTPTRDDATLSEGLSHDQPPRDNRRQ